MNRRVLFVDDEPRVLEAMQRTLCEFFEIVTAPGSAEALELLSGDAPFAVIVSDMRMPGMNGAELLARAKLRAPNTVRVLLTGHADLDAAMAAVNQGYVFRFLSKPCPHELLIANLEAAVEQYRLVTTEHELLDKTLRGAVLALTDVLSLSAPNVFNKGTRVREYVATMAAHLEYPHKWELELAAMLCSLGCVALPPELLQKVLARQPLSARERQLYDEHAETGFKVLSHIPRLERVAAWIKEQNGPPTRASAPVEHLGRDILRLALRLDDALSTGQRLDEALTQLARAGHDARLIEALRYHRSSEAKQLKAQIKLDQLRIGMVLDEDVCTRAGTPIVGKGTEITLILLEKVRKFAKSAGIQEPLSVRMTQPQGLVFLNPEAQTPAPAPVKPRREFPSSAHFPAVSIVKEMPLLDTAAFKNAPVLIGSLLSEATGVDFEGSEAWTVAPRDVLGAALAMVDTAHALELEAALFCGRVAGRELTAKMLRQPDPPAALVREVLSELGNNVLGVLKTALRSEGYQFTLGLPDLSKTPTFSLQRPGSAGTAVYTFRAGKHELCVLLSARDNIEIVVHVHELQENMVLVDGVHNKAGTLLAPPGTRLTAATIERLNKHVPDRKVRVSAIGTQPASETPSAQPPELVLF